MASYANMTDLLTSMTGNGSLVAVYPTNATIEDEFIHDKIIVPVLWGLLLLLGIGGNGLVVYVMMRYAEKNATNCYIVNLAFTDLTFVIIVVPFTMMHYVIPEWLFGEALCRLHMYMIYVTLQATCLTMTAMTVDRYFAIVHPINSMRQRTPRVAIFISVTIWIVSLLISIPFAMYHMLVEFDYNGLSVWYCRETWPSEFAGKAAIIYVVTVCYLLPLLVISLCYIRIVQFLWNHGVRSQSTQANGNGGSNQGSGRSRGGSNRRRKASKMIAVVVFLFAASWLPIHIFQLWYKFDRYFPKNTYTYYYKIFAHTLSYANSCVNPFVYAFLGDGFRKGVRKAFPWLKRYASDSVSTPGRSSFNSRMPEGTEANDDKNTFTMSNLRKSFIKKLQKNKTEQLSNTMEPSGVYIGVPTEERFTRPPLVPRPECAVTEKTAGQSDLTYLESDI